MDLELRLARLEAEFDAFRQRLEDERRAADGKLAAQDGALLSLIRIAVALAPDASETVPSELRLWADELRARGDEPGALAGEELANRLVRTLPVSRPE